MKKLLLGLLTVAATAAPALANIPVNWKIGGGFNDQEITQLITQMQQLNLYSPVVCGGNVVHINAFDPYGNPAARPLCFNPNPAQSSVTPGMYNYHMRSGQLQPLGISGQFQQPPTLQQQQQQQQSPHYGNW